jgi:hypothetical protein
MTSGSLLNSRQTERLEVRSVLWRCADLFRSKSRIPRPFPQQNLLLFREPLKVFVDKYGTFPAEQATWILKKCSSALLG